MQLSQKAHWDAALQIFQYLKGHPRQDILLRTDPPLILTAICDFNWANCPITRPSVTGYLIILGGSPISWKMKEQLNVSRSSTEVEYRSMAITLCELKWLR